MKLIAYRATQPFELRGRLLLTLQRVVLPEAEGDKLVTEGFLVRVVNGFSVGDRPPLTTR
jgi:hypothetical protein